MNRAAYVYEADWWAALDLPVIRAGLPQLVGSPHLFTREEYERRYPDWPSATVEQVQDFCPFMRELAMFTVPATLVFAAWLGAHSIDIYGADMKGTGSYDGTTSDARTANRWARERRLFARAVRWLTERGVRVKRWT